MLKRLICLILLSTVCPGYLFLLAQNPVADSLRQQMEQLPESIEKFEVIIELTSILQRTDTDQALELAKQAILLAEKLNDELILSQAYNALGGVYRNRGETREASRYHQKALEKLRGTNHFQAFAQTYLNIALIHYYRGELPDALMQAERALSISQTYDFSLQKAQISNLIGAIYRRKGDFTQAIDYYFEARHLYDGLNNQKGVAQTINNIANIYLEQNQIDEALKSYHDVIDIYKEVDEPVGLAAAYNNIGLVYFRKGDFELAFSNYSQALRIYENTGHKREQVFALNKLAELATERDMPQAALDYLDQAQKVNLIVKDRIQRGLSLIFTGQAYMKLNEAAKGIEYLRKGLDSVATLGAAGYTVDAYRALADAYVQIEDFENAFHFQSALIAFKDSLNEIGASDLAENVRSARLVREKEEQISALERSQIQANYTRLGLLALLIGLILLAGLGFLFFRYRYKSRFARLLTQKNEEIAEQNRRLKNYSADLEQFAFIVSHNLKEPLRTIGNYTGLIEKRLEGKFSKEDSQFFGFVSQGVNHMHALLGNLLTYVGLGKGEINLEKLDMSKVIQQTIEKLSDEIEQSGAQITIQNMPVLYADKEGMCLLFYHLLSNAIKFRGEGTLEIQISYVPTNGYHLFSVTDNGIGMNEIYRNKIFEVFQRLNASDTFPGTGIGLAICRKIAEQHNGWISVYSQPEKGSTFQIHLPITG